MQISPDLSLPLEMVLCLDYCISEPNCDSANKSLLRYPSGFPIIRMCIESWIVGDPIPVTELRFLQYWYISDILLHHTTL